MVLSDTMRPAVVTTMVKVSIEIRNGSAHFNVAVRAQSIQQAANVVRVGYPDCGVRVKFPIDPEGFFENEPAPRAEIVGIDRPDLLAAEVGEELAPHLAARDEAGVGWTP
jgi:hypothetical protein